MAEELSAPPVLSTPDTYILEETLPEAVRSSEALSDEQIKTRYEINRTINEIRLRKWKRVALQFPDHMLAHSARVYQLLARGLEVQAKTLAEAHMNGNDNGNSNSADPDMSGLSIEGTKPVTLTILGDTSYGSCCVDEIAAEHLDADAVVHYGRACLSPTARLPVLHIFTTMGLEMDQVVTSFQATFPDLHAKVVLTADVPFAAHVAPLFKALQNLGYSDLFAASIIHDPSSAIPNRTVPSSITKDPSSLSQWNLFHISDPPTSLLLTLQSRMASIKVYPTDTIQSSSTPTTVSSALETSTAHLLRRRYALVTSLTTVSAWGILVNTLSVKNYLSILSHIQSLISTAGKKSYLFVVGKLNPAKLANFSEIGGWVVIGCWESSLIDSREFYRPIITPFELEMVLTGDDQRVWTGQWRGDFQGVLEDAERREQNGEEQVGTSNENADANEDQEGEINPDSESESEPPEFDLRTGKYVSRTRPMQRSRQQVASMPTPTSSAYNVSSSTALTRRSNGTMVTVNGVASPAAEYLAQKRSWRGLGSDFEVKYEEDEAELGSVIEEGRTGVARGYTVGEEVERT
ncbi:diphthamide biosynthesis protein 2 [Fonsecaea pedrosoi CBS 271.37]|uniref:2-(3-amino-3-carboxypropyl)histidine synthase subunit 2 n=1 Tax=Fonsecaea pedrosoi CBS 271.37 TaxID=1442368 RepID=A0A0D2GWS5_9EURO|nr:diphthamide biosynthesis protein 2 [Fonsecaea pedrosoi CBS 271.37]KIW83050.1 diphthamide biosynthesis protein 2 [Fonsecaea pedrosoi CBS 271.37]